MTPQIILAALTAIGLASYAKEVLYALLCVIAFFALLGFIEFARIVGA